ncbi:hypothetical protein ADIARSV_2533 [Arcticibacter svalbardensis MN12-7]|uniref:G:T/U mismatch-specific uracil/thymine DNA-glycosylase n=1 Tax=Arcticibacter svalbardensis MN12-7 TaxID=1150600 RepID=R9GR25_9SPHI|nr:hypothetical protein ADIARSV_2533 [Arcticibacter svalbardensis MN12-7]
MPIIFNKFKEHKTSPLAEILILGTFNPDTIDGPDFYYGRSRNFLWHLLPECWGVEDLKEAELKYKKAFMQQYKVDFADVIDALEIPEGEEENVDDAFIDSHVQQWNNIIGIIDTMPQLKAVYFTRKTFNGIPNMRAQMKLVSTHCLQKGIRFCKLDTPARYHSPEKQKQWVDTIILQNTCLRV